jgi:5-(carboxyamino)imidazole ribonucleotide synthase
VLKTASFGYDGKGQVAIPAASDGEAAWDAIGRRPAVLEQFVDFERELSVIVARGDDGAIAHYGAIENRHAHHILDVTIAPAAVTPAVHAEAERIARAVVEALDLVGVLCVELFLARDGRLLVNELAPRPHNSGHYTFDASATSQFEQQLRAVCGLPLGSTAQLAPAAMANLLGDLWAGGEPRWDRACAFPGVKLHVYGKTAARRGRKMGHLTALASTTDDALATVLAARAALTAP